jgi:hypothetical protein
MQSDDLSRSLPSLFSELVYGAPETGAFVLNRGDPGLLASLDGLSAAAASTSSSGGATIAAHVDHVRYGLSLVNRWAGGENSFEEADWSAAWKTGAVSEEQWRVLREDLRREADAWHAALASPRRIEGAELDGVIGSVIHLAYHLGALRQIDATLRGPKEASARLEETPGSPAGAPRSLRNDAPGSAP